MRCLCRTGRACFFLFCLSPVSLNRLFLSGDETSFLSPGVGCCPRIRSQLAHTGPTGRVCCFAGVVSLPGCQNRTRRHTGASLVFLLQNKFTPPPKGGGAGHRLSWVCWSFPAEKPGAFPQEKTDTSYPMTSLAVACGNCWSQTVHTAPTGPV